MIYLNFDNILPGTSKMVIDEARSFTENDLNCLAANHLEKIFGVHIFDFYLVQNGKLFINQSVSEGEIQVIPRLVGGKGGFGSMLRAIGAQIEKTTNREACRDLSGRRLRDINEEKRLKKWIAEQAQREQEALNRKRKKLEKLTAIVKHDFQDEDYTKARVEMTEKIYDSVEEGLKAATEEPSCSKNGEKNGEKNARIKDTSKKKVKGNLWVDDLDSLEDSDSISENEEESPKKKIKLS